MPLITTNDMRRFAPRGKPAIISAIVPALNTYLPQYEIDMPNRIWHFMGQAYVECDQFRTMHEYASGSAYEGRKDLGNTEPGDGVRYKGRGIFQCTGRANYAAYGRKLGLDLVNNPELAAVPEVSVRIACEYWKAKGLNGWADRNDPVMITKRINGGRNHLAERIAATEAARQIWNFTPMIPQTIADIEEEVPDAPIAAEPAKRWWQSSEVVGTISGASTGVAGLLSAIFGVLKDPIVQVTMILVIGALAAFVIYRRMQKEP
jgi:predicted chitinase